MKAKISHYIRRRIGTTILACGLAAASAIAGEADIPVLNADIGRCAIHFTVKDPQNNPLYNAKIRSDIRYGFMSLRRMSLEVRTNADGKAAIIGLPESPRKEFEFEITSGIFYKKASRYPSTECEKDAIRITFGPKDVLGAEASE